MDTLSTYRQLIEELITHHAKIPYSEPDVKLETIFDRQSDRYLLMIIRRDKISHQSSATKRVHGCLIHGKYYIY